MMRTILNITCLAVVCLSGCQKDNNPAADPSRATLTIASPSDSATYKTGDTVRIAADATYYAELHGLAVSITDATDSSKVYYADDLHVHSDRISYQGFWIDTCTTTATLKVNISVILDHNGAAKEQYLYIKTTKP